MEYFVRSTDNKNFEIAKFDGNDEPEQVYHVKKTLTSGWLACDCWGFRKNPNQNHKHCVMIMYYEQHGYNHFNENCEGEKLDI